MASTASLQTPLKLADFFCVGTDVFSSPNSTTIPEIPSSSNRLPTDLRRRLTSKELKSFSDLRWFSSKYPHAPFATPLETHGPLLGRLAVKPSRMTITSDGDAHSLSADTRESWERLEWALWHMSSVLLKKADIGISEATNYRLPTDCGYRNSHPNPETARVAAAMSREAFLPLAAMASFATSVFRDSSFSCPEWLRTLVLEHNVLESWLVTFRDSTVGKNYGVKRTGVFISAADSQGGSLVATYIRGNVPVWIHWGTLRDRLVPAAPSKKSIFALDPFINRYAPSRDWIDNILRERSGESPLPIIPRTPFAASPSSPFAASPSPAVSRPPVALQSPTNTPPEPRPDSRQRLGETPQEFFARESLSHSKRLLVETPAQRERRLSRELEASGFLLPAKTTVFEWVMDNGFRIRTKLVRREKEEAWLAHPNSQKRYNGFTNEWDICEDFDPTYKEERDLDLDYTYHGDVSLGSDLLPSTNEGLPDLRQDHLPPQTLPPPPSLWQDDLAATFQTEPLELIAVSKERTAADHAVDELYHRFGFTLGSEPYTRPAVPYPVAEWSTLVCRHLSLSPVPKLELRITQPVSDFVRFLEEKVVPPPMPGVLWDLSQSNTKFLRNDHPRVEIKKRILYLGKAEKPIYSVVSLAPHQDRAPTWVLAVSSARAALEILRRGLGPKLLDVAEFFFDNGIPFHTFLPPSSLPCPRLPPFVDLGYRAKDHAFDVNDFMSYIEARDSFLCFPHARAALLRGGIIWRLAVDVLGSDTALMGPSDTVDDYGARYRFGSSQDANYFVDDSLSDRESELICGVYKVWTTQGMQTADVSWWPKASTWEVCSLNVGYWTGACEGWFQTRLRAIRDDKAGPKTAKQWRAALKMNRVGHKITGAYEVAADMFLAGQRFT